MLATPEVSSPRHGASYLALTLAWGCVGECIISVCVPIVTLGVVDVSATVLNLVGAFLAGIAVAVDDEYAEARIRRACASFQAGFIGVCTSYTFVAEQVAPGPARKRPCALTHCARRHRPRCSSRLPAAVACTASSTSSWHSQQAASPARPVASPPARRSDRAASPSSSAPSTAWRSECPTPPRASSSSRASCAPSGCGSSSRRPEPCTTLSGSRAGATRASCRPSTMTSFSWRAGSRSPPPGSLSRGARLPPPRAPRARTDSS